jgi:hypothetical protein
VTSVKGASQSWIAKSSSAVRYFSFNAPTTAPAADQCGRAVFSDLHVMGSGAVDFPSTCPAAGGLSAQQKAVEFLFFDLSACVEADSTPPSPPR